MLEDSLLGRDALPEAFECRVRGRLALPGATVELHDYRFGRPQSALFEQPHGFLDLAVSHRPGRATGRYVAEGSGARELGDLIFIPGGQALRSEWGAGAQSSICCSFAEDLGERDGWTAGELDASLDIRSPFVRDAMMRLAREIESPGFASGLMAEALCVQLGIELDRYFRATRGARDETAGRLTAAQLRDIEERLDCEGQSAGVAELAQACGLSTRHFFRLFRATTGTTLTAFAAERRLARARAMLAAPRPPIKSIAWACGFETAAAFSAAFRRATGASPSDYRRRMLH